MKVAGKMISIFFLLAATLLLSCEKETDGQNVDPADFGLEFSGIRKDTEIYTGQTLLFDVRSILVAKVEVKAPEGWKAEVKGGKFMVVAPVTASEGKYDIRVVAVSSDGARKNYDFVFTLVRKEIDGSACKVWNDFVMKTEDNVLLDFSYAGYKHGEVGPPSVSCLGYTVYDVTDYGAVPDDGKSDREAFIRCVNAALGNIGYEVKDKLIIFRPKERADAIVYFPEGEFILHTSDDNAMGSDGKIYSRPIQIRAGNFVMRGAGRDKTTIVMKDPNLPTDPAVLYSSPVMLEFKHGSTISHLTDVTAPAAKGSFSVEVASASGLSAGDWVCLYVKNNAPEFVAEELYPYTVSSGMTDIKDGGVRVTDYHQIHSVDGRKVTFCEPIMRAVDPKWGWQIMKYPHYENVGIEDLTFKGNGKDRFDHHASWEDDGAYKPLNMVRLTDSWMRRVRFTSVSEGCSIKLSANISAYDIIIDGRRGHASVRSDGSSRVFIGAVADKTSGYRFIKTGQLGEFMENAGQYHAVGVAKPSMGTVLWRNVWGNDSCFESHATQPRATLIDCCRGGWMRWRQGGDDAQVPNHLGDLTVWNFTSTTPFDGEFCWWDHNSRWWKFIMPTVVGFHGESCNFLEEQMTLLYSNGVPVNPESLYEAQLQERLGTVPAWLNELK